VRIRKKLRQLWRRRRFEADLAEEVRIHREMAAEVGAQFGSEAYFLEESRAVWGFGWLDSLGQDIRYALRGFRKAPLFALTVVGTIGLALGLNTTIFTVFDAYMLRPSAVRDPRSLYEVWWTSKSFHPRVSWRAYQNLARLDRVFADVAATDFVLAPVDGRFGLGQLVTGNYFQMLRPGAFAGRLIEPEDAAAPGARPVMVLSYQAWRNWYGANGDVLGRKVLLRGQPFEIIGVANPMFSGVGEVAWDFWIPISMDARVTTGDDLFGPEQPEKLRPLVRLRHEVSEASAKSALWAWAGAETAGLPPQKRVTGVEMLSRATAITMTPQMLATVSPIFVAFGLVLAAACANVSNMMLARALARQREIGIRVSLGAGRARLVRQLLTESVLLAVPAALAGALISQASIRFTQWLMFTTLPAAFAKLVRVPRLDPDMRVFGFILAASFAATLLFGLIPAIQTTRSNLVQANRGDFGNEYRPTRLRNALVAAQATICCLLLTYAVVMMRSVQRTAAVDIGMRTQGVFNVQTSYKAAPERLASQPGIEGVAGAWRSPIIDSLRPIAVAPAGGHNEFVAGYNFVSPEYFSLMRIPLLQGRAYTPEEARSGAAVVVISQATAKRFWPGQPALGETLLIPPKRPNDANSDRRPVFHSAQVIGITRDVASGFVGNGVDATCLYFPTTRSAFGNGALMVAARGDKDAGKRLIETALNSLGPDAADQINPMDEVLATMIYPFRVAFWISGFLAGLALLLTVSGIYGVMSFLVSQRSKEIGIRMALGANSGTVVRMVMTQSMRMAGIGAAVGAAIALMAAPVFANELETLQPYDPMAFGLGAAVVIGASLGAALAPSRRAARIDPVVALRCD
jgi:putative ABC transport system permease protein